MVLNAASPYEKINLIEKACHQSLLGVCEAVPEQPARDIPVFLPGDLPAKKGLNSAEGQARLLHDLANIELQAMELGYRTLNEFSDAPTLFREELSEVVLSEARHLKLCLDAIEKLGFTWGSWPIHMALWNATSKEDSLIDRILIVHRYLEGSGLDAGETILRKLTSIAGNAVTPVMKIISDEEVGHVEFGSRWYREICKSEGLDSENDFKTRMHKIRWRVPKRLEKISWELRRRAGFTQSEIQFLEDFRNLALS